MLPDNGAGHNLNLKIQDFHQFSYDYQLLEVLLAKICPVRMDQEKELANDLGNTVEMPLPVLALHNQVKAIKVKGPLIL